MVYLEKAANNLLKAGFERFDLVFCSVFGAWKDAVDGTKAWVCPDLRNMLSAAFLGFWGTYLVESHSKEKVWKKLKSDW